MKRRTTSPLRHAVLSDSRGLSTVEYVIILALVAIVGFVVWQMLGRHAAESNRGAGEVVNGLATHSSTEEGGEHGGGNHNGHGGAGGAGVITGHGGSASAEEAAAAEAAAGGSLWRWGILAAVVFGGMIFWLARQKSG